MLVKKMFVTGHVVRSHARNKTLVEPIYSVLGLHKHDKSVHFFFLRCFNVLWLWSSAWCVGHGCVSYSCCFHGLSKPFTRCCFQKASFGGAVAWTWPKLRWFWKCMHHTCPGCYFNIMKRSFGHRKKCHLGNISSGSVCCLNISFSLNSLWIVLECLPFNYETSVSHRSCPRKKIT